MTPPPYLADMLLVKSSHTIYASYPGQGFLQMVLFATSKEPPGLLDAVTALPQLLQALEYAHRCASAAVLDANPHGDLQPGDSAALDAATLERDTYRAALTAAGYTFND